MSDRSSADARRAMVVAAGTLPPASRREALLRGASLVVAADGGLRHALSLGLEPDVVVGDMDSVRPRDLERVTPDRVERHPRDKDDLDLELALEFARGRGAVTIDVLGAFGSRLDQSFAALLIAARYASLGVDVRLHGAEHEARTLVAGGSVTLVLPIATTVSLLALGQDARVSTSGLRFSLHDAALPFGRGLGVSNEVAAAPDDQAPAGHATVTVDAHAGTLAVLIEHASPADPRRAIWGRQQERIEAGLAANDPDLADLIGRVAYDEVFARPGLDLRARELLAVAMLTAMGADRELPTHVRGALLVGASEEELRESVLHAAMFAGFPRALAAMRVIERMLGRAPEAGTHANDPDREGEGSA